MINTLLGTTDIERGNILIVDDDPDILFIIENALEDQHANLVTASTGQEALSALGKFDFDVLLLDVKLPDISGFEICRLVKSDPAWQHIKVLMVSANANFDDKVRAYEFGADDYIVKPFKNKEFQARIKVMLNLSLAERALTHRNSQLLEIIKTFALISNLTDLKTTADIIIKSACKLTKADRGYLFLWNEKRYGHWVAGSLNPRRDVSNDFIPNGYGVTGLVRQRGEPLILQNSEEILSVSYYDDQTVSAIAVSPLKVATRYIGCLLVSMASPHKKFSSSDIDMLSILSSRAAIAIENVRLYDNLSRSEEKYRLIAEKASDLIVAIDHEGFLTYINERSNSLLQYQPNEMIGQPFEKFLAEESYNRLDEIYKRLTENNNPQDFLAHESFELVVISKNAEPYNLEFNFGLLFQEGEMVGLQAIGRDVTARKQSDQLERMRLLGQMSSGVAHDFNNILANILGHAQLLAQELDDLPARQILQIIEQSARDGAETVRRIQEFTNNRDNQRNLEILDVNEVVQSVIDMSRPRWRDVAQEKGINISIERNFGSVGKVLAKAASLREALINLINNAVDAMSESGGTLGFRTYMIKSFVYIDLYDTGTGMTPEVRKHIFEPYFTTKGVLGTGLGLSMTYSIITRFGGQITCQSSVGFGTTFTIKLPVVQMQSEQSPYEKPVASNSYMATKFSGKILAVDDEANIRSILKRVLQLSGFEVTIASSGAEALTLLEETAKKNPDKPFDLVFSDLGMPGIGGWEVAAAVKRKYPTLPVVLVTGWGDQLDPVKLEQVAVQHTLSKPFNITDLVNVAVTLIPQAEKK
jgi:PAS domain S-box-containing protein